MNRTCARSIAGILLLAALAASSQAQTLERYAGGARLTNSPALSTPLSPGELALAPDGRLLVIDAFDGNIFRFDPANASATVMPEEGTDMPGWPRPYSYFRDLAVDSSGKVYASWGNPHIRVLDLANGGDEAFAGSDYQPQPTQCNGTPYYPANFGSVDDMATLPGGKVVIANGAENRICILEAGWDDPRAYSRSLAGTGPAGYDGDGGPPQDATFNHPRSIATDSLGNVYVGDADNFRIRKFSAADPWMPGNLETIAGTGVEGYNGDGIPAITAQITEAKFLTVDDAGNLYFFDRWNLRVRRIDGATGLISTVAGNGEWSHAGAADGEPATSAGLADIAGLVAHPDGGLYISERENLRVRRVDLATGTIHTVLGNGTMNYCGEGPRLKTCFDNPNALAIDPQGHVYVADQGNQLVRRIDAVTGITRIVAGKVTPVRFDEIGEFVSNEHGGDGGPATEATFGSGPFGVGVDAAGNVYIATGWDHRLRRVDAATGIITTVAGNGEGSSTGDGGPAVDATVDLPNKVLVAPNGDVYFSESAGNRVRRISAVDGIITTVAGNGLAGGPLGDGGPGPLASLDRPDSLAFDANGHLLIADQGHVRVRRLNLATGIITTVVGSGVNGQGGDGGPATSAQLGYPLSVAADAANNLFVTGGHGLRRVDANTGVINRANASWGFYSSDGHGMGYTTQIAFAPDGSLFSTNASDNLVMRVPDLPLTPVDTTPPVITPVITGTLGNDGWYRGNVTLTWNVVDPESSFEYPGTTCGMRSITTDTTGVTYTCTTTSAGGVASRSVTIKRDTAAPTLSFGAAFPAADANGWHRGPVSIPFTTSDATSGVSSTSSPNPVVISEQGTGLTRQVIVTDRAGNSATFTTAAFKIDLSAPVIQHTVNGIPGNNGWYRGNVQVNWLVTDPQSPYTTSGCAATTVTTDTTGVTFTCSATSGGGTLSSSVTVKRDATPPTLVFAAPSPAPNAQGWNGGPVSIGFTMADATSGLAGASRDSPLLFNIDGTGMQLDVVVVDQAGNEASFVSPAVNIDGSAPVLQALVTGAAGSNGWYRGDVQVQWSIDDLPGIESVVGCDGGDVTADTAGVTFDCTATSAGGTTSSSVTIKRDATPPQLGYGSPSPVPNANGWNKTNVSIPFTTFDALSGVASTSTPSPLVLSTEGADVTGEVVVTDQAGNVATFPSVARNIDKSVPVIAVASPASGATFGFYQDVVADYACTDVSLRQCAGPVADGAWVNTRTAGARTFRVTASDAVSLSASLTHGFNVESSFNWQGFLAPIVHPSTLNLVSRGTLVPIRWQLPDGRGGFVSNTASFASATVGSLSCGGAPSVPLNDTASGPAGISYDASTQTFTYNWQTGGNWSGCRRLTIKLRDNSTHELRFRFQ
jgi:hypothetical protein